MWPLHSRKILRLSADISCGRPHNLWPSELKIGAGSTPFTPAAGNVNTSLGFPKFFFLVFELQPRVGQTDGQTDRRTDGRTGKTHIAPIKTAAHPHRTKLRVLGKLTQKTKRLNRTLKSCSCSTKWAKTQTRKQSVAVASRQGGGTPLPLRFYHVGKFSSCRKIFFKNTKFGAGNPYFKKM